MGGLTRQGAKLIGQSFGDCFAKVRRFVGWNSIMTGSDAETMGCN